MTALVWFRRDLRLQDNPALSAALQSGQPVTAVYIWSPEEARPWSPGAASRWYLHQSLLSLQRELGKKGIILKLLKGETFPKLMELVSRCDIKRIYWNKIYEPSQLKIDHKVATTALGTGLSIHDFHDHSLFPPGSIKNGSQQPYKVFTPFWRNISKQLLRYQGLENIDFSSISKAKRIREDCDLVEDLDLLDEKDWHHKLHQYWQAGESAALIKLKRFLSKIDDYPKGRDYPDCDMTSSLSASLHFGEISPWRITQAVLPLWEGRKGENTANSAESFLRQLGWREFAIHLLNTFPQSSDSSLKTQFDDSGIWYNDPNLLKFWQQGKTGIPLVDAGMRQLWETGWMHNRVRMVVASVLTKNMGQHWIHGARWFWDTLVDADLANNTMGWQWVAGCGCDAAPYFRIFNPETQAKKFDPAGKYINRWGDSDYLSLPCIDLRESRKSALERYSRISQIQNRE